MKDIFKIRQINLSNGTIKDGFFYVNIPEFKDINTYSGHNMRVVLKRIMEGEEEFIVPSDEGDIKYEVINESSFSNEDKGYLCKLLNQEFMDYYSIHKDKMTFSERLFFNNIKNQIEKGFKYKIDRGN